MKKRLNITVDSILMEQAKRYAAKQQASLSELVEIYFKSITRPVHKKTAIDFLEELPKPKDPVSGNIRDVYYDQQKKKYGF